MLPMRKLCPVSLGIKEAAQASLQRSMNQLRFNVERVSDVKVLFQYAKVMNRDRESGGMEG